MERVCKAFRQNKDGSWTCTASISFSVPGGRMEAARGATYAPCQLYSGIELVAWLKKNCKAKP